VPGDQVRYEVEVVHRRPRYAKLAGRVLVGETLAADAVITSAMVDR
jgi:3-hydroxymyristoyl/3-hydroxydecanoyl-(acyl carrier protein) dehydratase